MAARVINLPQAMQNQTVGNRTLADAGGISQCIDQRMGTGTQDAVTASTTQTQAGGTKITYGFTSVLTAAGNDAITFPKALPGAELVIVNSTGQTINAFPFLGDAINAAGANNSVSIANVTTSKYFCTVSGQWWGGATTNET